ncbi:MAG: M14 family metallocarboxypeptidase [Oscillospiraceae bacterium]|nr:M14 family metallocarboxypeptidase [Oscillospiraceae bacterium]
MLIFNEKEPVQFVREKFYKEILKYKNVKHKIIGKSLCGRPIDLFEIGNSKDKILMAAGFHGLERLTILVLIKFLYELLINEYKISRSISIIPCVNPDGTEISVFGPKKSGDFFEFVKKTCLKLPKNKLKHSEEPGSCWWQANARGVDINHNFESGWKELKKLEIESGIVDLAPTRYGGEFPESEPETKAIVNLCKNNNFLYALAFHSQGEEIFWNYGKPIKNSKKMAEKLAESSGYKLSNPKGLAVGGGFKDWFITEIKHPAFTIEIGKGENPLPLSDFDHIYKKIKKLLFISLKM